MSFQFSKRNLNIYMLAFLHGERGEVWGGLGLLVLYWLNTVTLQLVQFFHVNDNESDVPLSCGSFHQGYDLP